MNANGDSAPRWSPRLVPWRTAARHLLTVLPTALLALLLATVAYGFSPPLGSDVMVTDASGVRFIGVGRVDDRGLVLELTERRSEIRFVVVPPGGEPQSFRGALRDGRLVVEDDDGSLDDLESLLGRQNRRLLVTWNDSDDDGSDERPPEDRDDPEGDGPSDDDGASPPDDEDRDGDEDPGGGDDETGGDDAPPSDDDRTEDGDGPRDDPDEGDGDDGDEDPADDDGLLPVDPPLPPSDDVPEPPLDTPDADVELGLP